jgi:hypothetical protein
VAILLQEEEDRDLQDWLIAEVKGRCLCRANGHAIWFIDGELFATKKAT